jgi:osmotically inducible protein OsmC
MFQALYTARVSVTGGRNGQVKSSDSVLDFKVSTPKEMGGAGEAHTNPEQLFAAGYAACFGSALDLVIRTEKITAGTTTVTAEVSIGKNDQGGYGLAIALKVQIPGVDKAKAEELAAKAHTVCPYSNATRGNVEVRLEVVG